MKKEANSTKETRKTRPQGFKGEVPSLAEQVGVPAAAKELGLHSFQIYSWHSKAKRPESQSDIERAQATKIARLKRQLAE